MSLGNKKREQNIPQVVATYEFMKMCEKYQGPLVGKIIIYFNRFTNAIVLLFSFLSTRVATGHHL